MTEQRLFLADDPLTFRERRELVRLRIFVEQARALADRKDGTAMALRMALVPLKERQANV